MTVKARLRKLEEPLGTREIVFVFPSPNDRLSSEALSERFYAAQVAQKFGRSIRVAVLPEQRDRLETEYLFVKNVREMLQNIRTNSTRAANGQF